MNGFAVAGAALLMFFLGDGSAAPERNQEDLRIAVIASASKGGWLGVRIEDMGPRLARRMNVTTETGALVNEVIKESPAEKAGIKEDDIIVGFHTRAIDDADELRTTVAKTEPGQSVQVTVMRRNEKKTLTVEVGSAPRHKSSWHRTLPGSAPQVRLFMNRWLSTQDMHGMTVRTLTKQLAEYFEVPGSKGVLVEEVDQKSAAGKAGLRAGDVVMKIGKTSVSDPDDLREAFAGAKKGDRLEVTLLRKGKQSTVNLEIEESLEDVYEGFHSLKIHPPLPPEELDLDIDVPDIIDDEPGQMEEFQRQMEEVRSQMMEVRERIRDQMRSLRRELHRELRHVSI